MVDRLMLHPELFQYGSGTAVEAIFGVPVADAQTVFYPVSRTRSLPDGFVPADLVNSLGRPLRKLALADFEAMFGAARQEGAQPVVVSGYRSVEYQAGVFERAVQRQLWRGESIEQAEADQQAARFVAPPGHSQHQLGTTADLSSGEIGYAVNAGFAETAAGRWLAEHAWEYGFVVPYTAAAESRTGYVPEPWHLRWIGRPLAALLWDEGYLNSGYPTADDWLLVLELVLARAGSLLERPSDP
jgi:D-alanyl-D-alanine carboxypeptidase